MATITVFENSAIIFPDVIEQPVSWGPSGDTRQTKRYKAITDRNTGKLFSIVSQNYKLIRHEEAIDQIENVIDKGFDLGKKYTIVTEFYNDGARMRRTYRFTEISIEVTKDDFVSPELHLQNSYDTTWPFMVLLGAFRFVCSNGLVVGKKFLWLKKRHIYELSELGLLEEVSSSMKRIESQRNEWKQWTKKPLTEDIYTNVINAMSFGEAANKEISDQIEIQAEGKTDKGFPIMNLWIFFNVITWYITHKAVSLNHRVQMETRLRRALRSFG